MTSQFEYVEKLLSEDIQYFENKRDYNRKATFKFTIIPACLSTLSTISIGIENQFENSKYLLITAIIASGTSSIISAWQSLFVNKTLWMGNNATLAELYKLKWKIEYRKSDESNPIKKEEIDDYYSALMKIHDSAEANLQQAYSGK